ncbi:MAG TPA: hypothetical protein PK876_10705 [Elusimicrobiota bacterium]|nr:hypothetical protein [Elusimicrobiota bacterium]
MSYSLRLGTGDYELAIPSGSVTNRLRNETPGLIWGLGVSWNLTPDTPVTPAVMLAVDYTRADYKLSRFQSGSAEAASVRQDFSLQEMQVALSASKKWKKWDPYGGVRFFRQTACVYDRETADRVYGRRDGYAPYAGCAYRFFEREELLVEVSGVDETLITLGVNIGF